MITYILAGIIVMQTIVHYIERREMTDRLMSRSLSEYKSEPVRESFKSAHEKILKQWRGEE